VGDGAKLYPGGAREFAMGTHTEGSCSSPKQFGLPVDYLTPRWYAAYTSANQEKRVAKQLGLRDVEHFLPLYSSLRRWKDRRVTLQTPLFPGYVFVHLALRDRLQVLQIPGFVHLVSFGAQPVALQEEDILALQTCQTRGHHLEPHPYLQAGLRARVKSGPLRGLEGIILRRKNRTRFILSFDQILRSVAVEVDEMDLALAG
jgi:transcription antitermination factor NusG